MKKEKRIVIRPEKKIGGDLLRMTFSAAAAVIYVLAVRRYVGAGKLSAALYLAIFAVWFILCAKHTVITLIYVYQKIAPGFIRGSCRFTPCCSEYTRISIEKYGVIRGICGGIGRIMRCHPPNGGIDEP